MQNGLITKPGIGVAKVPERGSFTMRENFAVREVESRVIAQRNQPWMVEPAVSQRRSKGYVSLQVELLKCLRDKRAARSVCAYLDVARRFNRRASSQRLIQRCREINRLGDGNLG
jgi:hypothetical protein